MYFNEVIKEKYINSSPEPVSIEKSEIIISQMKKCVCKIYYLGCEGTGFFIKIPYKSSLLPCLVTNHHIIDSKNIKLNNIITIYINEEKREKNIKLNEQRIYYTNKELDVTFIEIIENQDNIKNFLELDESIIDSLRLSDKDIEGYLKNIYSNKSIYVLNYPEGKNVVVSYGGPPKIMENEIQHKCIIKGGSSGSPILLLKSNKVIGIHYGANSSFSFNKGTLLLYAITDFNNKFNKTEKFTSKNMNILNRIAKEYNDIYKEPIANCGGCVSLFNENDLRNWRVSIIGPKDTSYKGGLFYLSINFPDEYPQRAPEVCFMTPIYHVNINPNWPNFPGAESLGHVSISILNGWKPIYTIREVIIHIFALLYNPNPDSPYGIERADELRFNRDIYEKKIKYFTKKYASPFKPFEPYPKGKNWDFSM